MHRLIIKYLNAVILSLCLIFALGAAFLWLCRPSEIHEAEPEVIRSTLPKGAFTQPAEAYSKVGDPVLSLEFQPPKLRIPDLKNSLVYYGKNGRPDGGSGKSLLHFSLVGTKETRSAPLGDRVYLMFNRGGGAKYAFSPQNEPTPLWIEANPLNQEVQITVTMLDEKGIPLTEPEHCHVFNLPEKEISRSMSQNWELGKWRVDATLLARQRARWFGADRFLEEHGGEEYKDAIGRQRIDFGEGDEPYSLFVKLHDCMIFENNRWRLVQPGENTLEHPLLVVKRIDERLMQLDLWDVQGRGRVGLNLLKTSENFAEQNFEQIFKFIGARTRSQFVFEIDNERMLLRPKDWLLLTDAGWKKLTTVQEIDDYVNRKLVGTLFVFDDIVRKEERQTMKGTVYNQNRTECYPIELAMQAMRPTIEEKTEKIMPNADPHLKEGLEAIGRNKNKPRIDPPSYAKQE